MGTEAPVKEAFLGWALVISSLFFFFFFFGWIGSSLLHVDFL